MNHRRYAQYFARVGPSFVLSRGKALLSHPLFLFLTVIGNGSILIGALTLYFLERGVNPRIGGFIDALWWSVATVTTVGYGDVLPVTALGKIYGMIFMIFGTAVFGSFMALFAAVLLAPEIDWMEKEVKGLERSIEKWEEGQKER